MIATSRTDVGDTAAVGGGGVCVLQRGEGAGAGVWVVRLYRSNDGAGYDTAPGSSRCLQRAEGTRAGGDNMNSKHNTGYPRRQLQHVAWTAVVIKIYVLRLAGSKLL